MVNSVTTTTITITTTTINPTTTTYWQFWILWLKCIPKDFLF